MADDITYVGLDVSKDAISVGVAPGGRREAAHYFGAIAHKALGYTHQARQGRAGKPRQTRRGGVARRSDKPATRCTS